MVVEEGLGGREDSERLLTLRLDVLLCKLRPTIFFVIFNSGEFLSVSDSSEAVSYMILSFDMSSTQLYRIKLLLAYKQQY